MLPIRIKACSESDLRMLGNLARNIQRVLPVTQADIDAAAALGKGWVVWKVIEVTDPIDNLRGGTQLVIKQNSITPGQNVRRVLIVSGPGGETVIVGPGPSPLLLPDAIADSLTYVKAFGGTEQRNLPAEYTQLEYVESTGTQWVDPQVTGNARWVITAQTNAIKGFSQVLISSTSQATGGSWYGEFTSTGYWDIVSGGTNIAPTTKTTADLTFDGDGVRGTIGSTSVSRSVSGTQGTWRIFITTNGSYPLAGKLFDAKVYQSGVLVRNLVPAKDSDNVVGLYDTVSGTFFTNGGTGTFTAGPEVVPTPDAPMDIISNNGVLVFRDTELPLGYKRLKDVIFDGEVYYVTDIYPTGADTITSTINATETGRNVLGSYTGDASGNNLSFYLAVGNNGNYVRYKDGLYRPVLANDKLNTDLTLSIGPTGTTGFDTDKTWTELEFTCPDELYVGWLANATSPKFKGSFKGNVTISNRAILIPCERTTDGAIGYYNINDNVFFENQGTGTPTTSGYDYSHYDIMADGTVETIEDTIGNTATAEMLLKVGDYQDEQDIPAGVVTRKVGIKVLDGTENWVTGIGGVWYNFQGDVGLFNTAAMICSHYSYAGADISIVDMSQNQFSSFANGNIAFKSAETTSAADFKTWLAAQYAAGTPVIVIYPLATETAESVAGQTLQVTDGDNTVEITQASLSGLELEAEYTKVA